ncbi:MAG TPA: RDD family protein [Acidimicrobiales bacterium]|nr:RDD family protein [Acidimicrobiales bacterium]
MSEPGIVTPEAVVLSFETAGVGSRIVAELIDLSVQFVAGVLVVGGAALLGATHLGLAGVYVGLFLVAFGYPVAMETLWRGRTLGKAAMGLRVVTVEGAPVRFRHALIRGALGLVDFWATSGAAAVLCVLATKRNQRLGDLAAGTLVLRERASRQSLSALTFWVPPGWEGYAATLDVSAVTTADYQAVRSFLVRAPTLDPWTRERLAREIANAVLPRLHHQPPPGVPAEVFLACVAALYQARQRRAPTGGTYPASRSYPASERPSAQ